LSDVLVLELGGERRSIPADAVREIVPLADLTPVPTAPASVRGLIQVRGQVIPVLDFGPADGPPPRPGSPLVIVEIEGERARAALVVERVLDVEADDRARARPLDLAREAAELKQRAGRR
jgi:purine-binding chemotaxis protein CheW